MILSGANLSEEYFVNRYDRYLVFTNGGNGIVDFYADLIENLCKSSQKYCGEDIPYIEPSVTTEGLLSSLEALFCANKDCDEDFQDGNVANTNVIAYAVPTIQLPLAFVGYQRKELSFASDVQVIRSLIMCATEQSKRREDRALPTITASLRLTSAYLNPTESFMHILKQFDRNERIHNLLFLLTAGYTSHGFAPKEGKKGICYRLLMLLVNSDSFFQGDCFLA